MIYLLDTHIFIWWDSEPQHLSPNVLAICNDKANTLLLSIASVWELQIKIQLGKLTLRMPLEEIIRAHLQNNDLQILSVSLNHIFAIGSLPLVHRDPFDRLLVAQALAEKIPMISHDTVVTQYGIQVIW